jgi:hypothetical protein
MLAFLSEVLSGQSLLWERTLIAVGKTPADEKSLGPHSSAARRAFSDRCLLKRKFTRSIRHELPTRRPDRNHLTLPDSGF